MVEQKSLFFRKIISQQMEALVRYYQMRLACSEFLSVEVSNCTASKAASASASTLIFLIFDQAEFKGFGHHEQICERI